MPQPSTGHQKCLYELTPGPRMGQCRNRAQGIIREMVMDIHPGLKMWAWLGSISDYEFMNC